MNIGERIGDYEIVAVLGAGGMGKVYKVRNVFSDRFEAMKVLLPNLSGDQSLADRFLREIKVQAALDHPNIARLNTAQWVGNQLVMVLEYVEGSTIEKLLENGPMGVPEAVGYIKQVLDALTYAHERGVVHRDIKPANIIRTPSGTIKLMDFGIARMQADRKLTQTGHTLGSLYYMSPEQIKGTEPDPRSDLYSLGVTLYEMVTGRKPFGGTSDFSIMAAHLEQRPAAPIEIVPGVPSAVNDAILMAITKEPETRFQSAKAFRAALDALPFAQPAAHTIAMPPPPPVMAAPVPPPMMPPPMPVPAAVVQKSSKRGLYMTLGSLATVGVIAAAIVLVPRFMGTGATNLPTVSQPAATTPITPPPADPVKDPVVPAATPEPPPAQAQPAPTQQPPAKQDPPVVAQPAKQVPAVKTPPVTAQQPPSRSQQTPPVVQQTPPVQVTPAAQTPVVQTPAPQQQPAAQTPTQQPPPPQQPAVAKQAAPPSPELNSLRELYNMISVRVATAKSGLRSVEAQQRRQGLDMRGDIIEAESRMDYLMKESMDSIRAGDAATGRRNLQNAERALETIEKFLGR